MLADEDHCLERLSCEFSDPNNYEAPELDRAVTSMYENYNQNNFHSTH
jgi:hypothetical protein